jgi:hypothetical protein
MTVQDYANEALSPTTTTLSATTMAASTPSSADWCALYGLPIDLCCCADNIVIPPQCQSDRPKITFSFNITSSSLNSQSQDTSQLHLSGVTNYNGGR